MMKRFVRTLPTAVLGLGLTLGLGACGDDEPTAPQNAGTIRVENQFPGSVLHLFLKECGTSAWGEDRLPQTPDGTIAPGSSRDFTVEAGCWDVGADVFTKPFDQDPTEEDLVREEVFGNLVEEGEVETVVLQGQPQQN